MGPVYSQDSQKMALTEVSQMFITAEPTGLWYFPPLSSGGEHTP